MINPIFANKFKEDTFAEFLQGLIPSLSLDKKRSEVRPGFKSIQQIGEVTGKNLDLVVFVADCESSLHARMKITKNTYAVLKSHARSNALVAYISDDSSEWRLSLVTTKVTRTKDGIKESISNPRRFSYVLGPNAKVTTPSKMLQGRIDSITDLENKFSLAVVSKEFYTQIATQYSKLVGGTRGEGKKAVAFERALKLGVIDDATNANFAIRLIGRLVFCWFLKQKKGHLDNPLIPSEILSVDALKTIGDYYHSVCVPLFFEVLNKPQTSRPTFFSYSEFFEKVPFLNGGLFQDHSEDNHKFNRTTGMSERRGVVSVPDIWFSELFQIFEEYNFTIDENTSIDTELSIDPEMLGRIFENLLAEVNPETGASARKATGSFYTPREIVDFMVEESLVAHLKNKTNISEEKLRALSSYDLEDDESNPVDQHERKLLIEAIHNTTVLDPACGSGAFPIGVLQRLVHILAVLDPECSIYLSKIPPEMRRQLQKHSLIYVRKLGVIRECIHGVDIQPIAIDISRLRCFLTLVVDQQVDDNAPNRGIEPLPNLDFKFVCANTLIKPPIHEGPLFADEFADALGELIDEYFAPADQFHKLETARKLQQLISDKTKMELENILRSYSYLKDENIKKALAKKNEKSDTERLRINNLWGSYANIFQNKPVGFFDTRYFFPAVHRQGGFDIVIANPPYVSALEFSKNHSSEERNILNNSFDSAKGTYDIYVLFIEKAITLLNDKGRIAFINPNKYLSAKYAQALREYIINNAKLECLVDVSGIDLFDEVSVYPVLSFMSKGSGHYDLKLLLPRIRHAKTFDLDNYSTTTLASDILTILPENIWGFLLSEKVDVLIKLVRGTKPLSEYGNINASTTAAEGEEYGKEISETFKDDSLKLLNTGLIDAYSCSWGKKTINQKGKKFLTPHLSMNTVNERRKKMFSEPKIMYAKLAKSCEAYLDVSGEYAALNVNFFFNPKTEVTLKYIAAYSNSRLFMFFYEQFFGALRMAGGYYQFQAPQLRVIPCRTPNIKSMKGIENLVDGILTITKSDDYFENPSKKEEVKQYEKQIDQLVYEIYNLTPEEIEIVEKTSK